MSTNSFLHLRWAWLGAGLIVAFGSIAAEEAPPASKGTKIIFSAPKSDTVSSNLNELRNPALPFQKLESGLKKPFEVFDPVGRSDVRPARAPIPTPQAIPKRSLKEQMNDRAEEMFLHPESFENSKDDNELFGLTEEDVDPYKTKPRNALDRYQDRMERDRPALTNNSSRTTDLFGQQKDALDSADNLRLGLKPLNSPEETAPAGSQPTRRDAFANTTDQEWTTAGRTGPRAFDSGFSGNPDSYQNRARSNPTEIRRDGFQRLLQDPASAHSGASAGARTANPNANTYNPYLNPYQTTPTPRPNLAPTPTWNTRPVAVSGAGAANDSFSKTVGLVGEPVRPEPMREYTVSATFKDLNSAPEPQPAPAIATPKRPAKFQIPQRTY